VNIVGTNLDKEIQDLEHRLAQRKLKVELLARASGRRAVRSLVSPAGLIGAAALGFLAVTGVTRRQHYRPAPALATRQGKLAGLMGLAASAAFALLRAQFGSPAQMAQLVLSKLKKTSPGVMRRPQRAA
jgi:hypothetical protein